MPFNYCCTMFCSPCSSFCVSAAVTLDYSGTPTSLCNTEHQQQAINQLTGSRLFPPVAPCSQMHPCCIASAVWVFVWSIVGNLSYPVQINAVNQSMQPKPVDQSSNMLSLLKLC